jgi:hypothetical protein
MRKNLLSGCGYLARITITVDIPILETFVPIGSFEASYELVAVVASLVGVGTQEISNADPFFLDRSYTVKGHSSLGTLASLYPL